MPSTQAAILKYFCDEALEKFQSSLQVSAQLQMRKKKHKKESDIDTVSQDYTLYNLLDLSKKPLLKCPLLQREKLNSVEGCGRASHLFPKDGTHPLLKFQKFAKRYLRYIRHIVKQTKLNKKPNTVCDPILNNYVHSSIINCSYFNELQYQQKPKLIKFSQAILARKIIQLASEMVKMASYMQQKAKLNWFVIKLKKDNQASAQFDINTYWRYFLQLICNQFPLLDWEWTNTANFKWNFILDNQKANLISQRTRGNYLYVISEKINMLKRNKLGQLHLQFSLANAAKWGRDRKKLEILYKLRQTQLKASKSVLHQDLNCYSKKKQRQHYQLVINKNKFPYKVLEKQKSIVYGNNISNKNPFLKISEALSDHMKKKLIKNKNPKLKKSNHNLNLQHKLTPLKYNQLQSYIYSSNIVIPSKNRQGQCKPQLPLKYIIGDIICSQGQCRLMIQSKKTDLKTLVNQFLYLRLKYLQNNVTIITSSGRQQKVRKMIQILTCLGANLRLQEENSNIPNSDQQIALLMVVCHATAASFSQVWELWYTHSLRQGQSV